jgi:hypothetical protein
MSTKKPPTYTLEVLAEPLDLKAMIEEYAGVTREMIRDYQGGTLENWVGERMNPPASREQFTKWKKATNINTDSLYRILDGLEPKAELKILVGFFGEWRELTQFKRETPTRPVGRPKKLPTAQDIAQELAPPPKPPEVVKVPPEPAKTKAIPPLEELKERIVKLLRTQYNDVHTVEQLEYRGEMKGYRKELRAAIAALLAEKPPRVYALDKKKEFLRPKNTRDWQKPK